MARITHYKTLNKKLIQFKTRFPYCKHFIENKKTTKRQFKKKATKAKETCKEYNDKNLGKLNTDPDEKIRRSRLDEKVSNDDIFETGNISHKREKTSDEDSVSSEKQKLKKDDISKRQSNMTESSSIMKEATVKRFARLLKEQKTDRDARISVEIQQFPDTGQVKTVDDFFIAGNDPNDPSSDVSTSRMKFVTRNTHAPFQFNDRIKKRDANHKNDRNFSKKYSDKPTSIKFKKLTSNRIINKSAIRDNITDAIANKRDENNSLHPSWLAKKKEQEIMSQGFKGKKIVFTND